MRRVLYDGFIYTLQSNGGINRYFSELISRLPEEVLPGLLCTTRREVNFPEHHHLRIYEHARFAFRPGRLAYWLEQHLFQREMRRFTPHIIHPSYHHTLLRLAPRDIPGSLVYTVYDCLYDVFADQYDQNGVEREALRNMLERADRILAISHATKSDIVHYYGIDPEKIVIQHLGASPPLSATEVDQERAVMSQQAPYFLFVGNRWDYKRFPLALQAFRLLRERIKDVQFRVVGPSFSSEEKSLLPDGVYEEGPVSNTRLRSLYSGALALVYPSVYEGFGLPVLEAMGHGTPVIACRVASIPEVGGDAALLVEPDSLEALESAMALLATSEQERENRKRLGMEQAKKFSWDKARDVLVSCYQEIS